MNPRLAYWKTRLCAELGVQPYTTCDDMRISASHTYRINGESLGGDSQILLSVSVPDDCPPRAVDFAARRFFGLALVMTKAGKFTKTAEALSRLIEETEIQE